MVFQLLHCCISSDVKNKSGIARSHRPCQIFCSLAKQNPLLSLIVLLRPCQLDTSRLLLADSGERMLATMSTYQLHTLSLLCSAKQLAHNACHLPVLGCAAVDTAVLSNIQVALFVPVDDMYHESPLLPGSGYTRAAHSSHTWRTKHVVDQVLTGFACIQEP